MVRGEKRDYFDYFIIVYFENSLKRCYTSIGQAYGLFCESVLGYCCMILAPIL